MIEYLSMRDIQAVQYVQRWHMIRMNRAQNLAEHSYTVALLAGKLACCLNDPPGPKLWAEVLEYALIHDLPEVDFGDIPTPTKRVMEKLGGRPLLRAMDNQFWASRGDNVDLAISKEAQHLVILADKIEAYLYYSEEGFDVGIKLRLKRDIFTYVNRHFHGVMGIVGFLEDLP